MLIIALLASAIATHVPTGACPRQAKRPALSSAAPSFQSVRYASLVLRSNKAQGGSAVLIRSKRRFECDVHDRTSEWKFKLLPEESTALLAAAAGLQQQSKDEAFVVTDGTKVEVKHFVLGKLYFAYGINGLAK